MDGQLLYEKKGNTELHYLYDANGSLRGIQTVGEIGTVTTYYVVTNTRGDITRIYNEVGELQVLYSYDSWGKVLSIKDGNGNEITSDNHIGKLNSLRYRGYYYDDETGLYYLQSRYYDPEVKRFINADGLLGIYGVILTHNLFSYCWNNPINMNDLNGQSGTLVLAGGFAAADGPFPLGDLIATGIVVYEGGKYVYNNWDNLSSGAKKLWNSVFSKTGKKEKSKDKPKVKIKTPTSNPEEFTKLKGNQGYKDKNGNTWKKDQLHKDHWDISNKKGNKIQEVDFNGKEIWPNGPKNKNK